MLQKLKMLLPWVLVCLVMLSGVAVTFQVQSYRQSFTYSESLRDQRKNLDNQWFRLLIEQQTFGATTQIGSRAVVGIGMYSPKASEIITLDAPKYPALGAQQ